MNKALKSSEDTAPTCVTSYTCKHNPRVLLNWTFARRCSEAGVEVWRVITRAKEATICLVLDRNAQIEFQPEDSVLSLSVFCRSFNPYNRDGESVSMACKGTFQGTSGFCMLEALLDSSAISLADSQTASSYLRDNCMCRNRRVTKVSAALLSPLQEPWDLTLW